MSALLIGDVIDTAAARMPGRIAATMGDQSRTFAEVAETARHLAAVLSSRGVSRGDPVGWWGETSIDVVPFSFALAHLGAVFVPLNPRYGKEEAGRVLDRVDPRILVVDESHEGDVELNALLAERQPSAVELPQVDESDPLVVFFTSGTTGAPKGVVLSHRTQRLRGGNGTWPQGATICMFPQFHMAGWSFSVSSWLSGDELAYVERPDADNLLGAIERRRAHVLYAIPAVWRRILEADRSRYDLSSLREANTGTSATSPELLQAITDAFPATTTTVVYGSTEAGGVCLLWPQDVHRKPNSVGPPSPGVSVRCDDHGELWVRSPFLFSGYFRDPEATDAALVNGWFRTGELAERDEEGYYYIVGRAKDLIRTGGETVAPVEVDQVLQRHPAIADAAVAGVPDSDWGEIVTAFVVLRPGQSLLLPELRRHCEAHLAAHKHPRRLVVLDAIPRTGPTGQVQRRRLVEIAAAQPAEPRSGS